MLSVETSSEPHPSEPIRQSEIVLRATCAGLIGLNALWLGAYQTVVEETAGLWGLQFPHRPTVQERLAGLPGGAVQKTYALQILQIENPDILPSPLHSLPTPVDTLTRAAEHLQRALGGHTELVVNPKMVSVQAVPDGTQPEDGKPCYTAHRLKETIGKGLAELDTGTYPQIVARDAALCRAPQPLSPGKASAETYTNFAAKSSGRLNYYNPGSFTEHTFAHEFGHTIGLGHNPAVRCGQVVLQDFAGATAPNGPCDIVRLGNDPKKPANPYSGEMSVMGSEETTDLGQRRYPIYANIQLALLFPRIYHRETIPATPAAYTLSHESGALNAVGFKLAENHPLRRLYPQAGSLVASYETYRLDESPGSVRPRCRGGETCTVRLYLLADGDNSIVELPDDNPRYGRGHHDNWSFLFLDKNLGIGLTTSQRPGDGSITLHVIPYQDGERIAQNIHAKNT